MKINEIFTYNQHFVAMMNVINAAKLNPPKNGHKHHIIPRCWFTMNNLPIDNSKENLVLLTYEDHCKVHKLMYLCAKEDILKRNMAYAYHRLTKGQLVTGDCFKGNIHPMYGKTHSEESRKKMSVAAKGRTHDVDTCKKMSEAVKGEKNPFYGKHHSEETRKKMSASRLGKKRGPYKKRGKECR